MSEGNQQPADFPDDEADSRRFNAQLAAMRPPRRPPPDLAPPMIECRLEEERAWAAAAKPIIPGETLTVYEGALAFRDRAHLPRAVSLEDIEHYIGRPYQHEEDPFRVTLDERPPKDKAERNRRTCWEVACELLDRIDNGMMRTVLNPGNPPLNKYAQVIQLIDYLRYAKERGGYGDVVEGLIAQHEAALSEATAEGNPLPCRATKPKPQQAGFLAWFTSTYPNGVTPGITDKALAAEYHDDRGTIINTSTVRRALGKKR